MSGWQVLSMMLEILKWLILIRVLLSWVVPPTSRNPLVELLRSVTDTVLRPIQSVLPSAGGMDFSPLVALLIIYLVQNLLAQAAY